MKKYALEAKEVAVRFDAERAAYEAKILKLEDTITELEIHNENQANELRSMKEILEKNNIKVDQTQKNLMNKIQDLDKLRNRYEECVEGLTSPPKKGASRY